MKAIYDNKPSTLEAVGNGSYLYRYNITEVTNDTTIEMHALQWECDEVTVWSPISSNKITEAVINEQWPNNYEQKLVNEYNAANLGLYGEKTSTEAKAKMTAYADFLTERAKLKATVDSDCMKIGIK